MARMTKKQILSLTPQQIEQMRRHNLKELKRITSDIQAINRKSYMRSKAAGIDSPFVSAYEKTGGPMSLRQPKGLSEDELSKYSTQIKNELETQLSLLGVKTRTFKGAQDVYAEMVSKIDPTHQKFAENIKDMDKDEIKQFWDVYHKLSQAHVKLTSNGSDGSPPGSVSQMILDKLDPDKSVDDILKEINKEYNELYKEEEKNDRSNNPYIQTEDEY